MLWGFINSRCLGIAVALIGLPIGSTSTAEVVLKAGTFLPPNTSFGGMFTRWVDKVNADGKGLVRLDIVAGPSAIAPPELANAVKAGVLDIANVAGNFYQNLLPVADAAKLITKQWADLRRNGGYDWYNGLHHQRVNAHLVAVYGGPDIAHHIYLTKKIDKLEDLRGMKLRSSATYRSFFQSLGVTPIQLNPSDAYPALEKGIVQGYGWPAWDIKAMGWLEVTKFRIDPPVYSISIHIIANLPKWNSLSGPQREFLSKMGIWLEEEFPKWAREKGDAEYRMQDAAGIKAIKLEGDVAARYLKLAYDAAWEEARQLAPIDAPILKRYIFD